MKSQIKYIFGFILLITSYGIPQTIGQGTAIIIYWTEDSIFVAADSKITYFSYHSNGDIDTSFGDNCKIGFVNNIGWASSGLDISSDSTNSKIFHISDMVRFASLTTTNIYDAFIIFKQVLQGHLFKTFNERLKKNQRAKDATLNPNNNISVAIFGFDNSGISIQYVNITPFWNADSQYIDLRTEKSGQFSFRKEEFLPLGISDIIIDEYQKITKTTISNIELVTETISNCIKRDNRLGGDIPVIIGTNNGFSWYHQPDVCK